MNRKTKISESKLNSYNLRIFLLMFLLVTCFGLVAFKLFRMQIMEYPYYKALAANQHNVTTTIAPKRGEIYFESAANGTSVLAATNLTKDMVFAIPKLIPDKKVAANRIAPLLGMASADVLTKLNQSPNYVPLKKTVDADVSAQVKNLNIPGIYLQAQDVRFYPENNLASQVLGFVGYKGSNRVGQYGIEGSFESELAGTSGILATNTDTSGGWLDVADRNYMAAKDGDDIYLTIDPVIQNEAQQVLQKTVSDHQATSGNITIINPKTGAVLAMANYPDFDPNNYNQATDLSVYNNNILSADYEPGSIFKAITMAAALNENKINPQTTYDNMGVQQVDDKKISNSEPTAFLGPQTMITVLDQSLNTGAYFAEQQIGNDVFKKYVQNFGFGKTVDFEIPGQVPGNLDNLNKKGNIFFATASFGQGITVTPLQMVQAYSAIANGGKMSKPYIVSKIIHPDGTEIDTKIRDPKQIIDVKTASTVSAMLVDVVENGHGKKAAVPGYYIAGKTGTAQVAFKNKSGYDPNQNIGSFIGFGPVDNPQFLMLVRIDNPKDVLFAETTAAPAFGEIAQFILNYLQVPPSR
jgi:cell division protein FtsI/penicillin-binding protein 2